MNNRSRLSRRDFVKKSLLWGGALSVSIPAALKAQEADGQGKPNPARPNIILIIADDLGWGQLGCYPHEGDWPTPHMDRLAKMGVRMSDGYSAHPMCLPSRASILTGQYYHRFSSPSRIDPGEWMIPRYLKSAGYASACIGKWHNTHSIGAYAQEPGLNNHPLDWGFDEFVGFLGGMRDYFDPDKGFQTGQGWIYMPIYRGYEPMKKIKYLTEQLTDEAVDFIGRRRDRPFFLYLSYNAIHSPWQAPQAYLDRAGGNEVKAMLLALDDGVGRVMDTLKQFGLADNTLVLFVGDNGGLGGKGCNWKLRSGKSLYFEGGIRVPWIAAWPSRLPAGKAYSHPVMHFDLLPTIVAAAGVEVPGDRKIDGENLLPYWRGEKADPPHPVLFWGEPNGARLAVRRGSWKLLRESERRELDPKLALYNLDEDVIERRNMLEAQPKVGDDLMELHRQWLKSVTASRH